MSDSEDEEYCWYSDPELEEEEEWNPEATAPGEWAQQLQTEHSMRNPVPTGNSDEFAQFVNWRAGMPPPPCSVSVQPNILHSSDRNYAELRRRKFLCLHYFSNMLGFSFDDKNEDVYPLDSIKEWNDIKEFTTWGDMLKEHIQGGHAARDLYLYK